MTHFAVQVKRVRAIIGIATTHFAKVPCDLKVDFQPVFAL